MLKTDVFSSPGSDRDMTRVRRIGFLVFSDAEALDVCGPLGVFANADYQLRAGGRTGERGYEVLVIAAAAGPVRTQSGLQIVATHSCDDVSFRLDTLIVAGGIGVEAASADPMLVAWLQAAAPRVRRLASVCSGAFLLAAAGLLDDRRITTHWMFCDRLAELYPSLCIDPDLIFVRDGHVYTSGGVTSGIDLALALVEEDLGRRSPCRSPASWWSSCGGRAGRPSLAPSSMPRRGPAAISASCRPGSSPIPPSGSTSRRWPTGWR